MNELVDGFHKVSDKLIQVFLKFADLLKLKKGKQLVKVILYVLFIILIFWIMKFPFYALNMFAGYLVDLFPTLISEMALKIWQSLMIFSHITVAIVAIQYLTQSMIKHKDNKMMSEILTPVLEFFRCLLIVLEVITIIFAFLIFLVDIFLIAMTFQGIYLIGLFFLVSSFLLFLLMLLAVLHKSIQKEVMA